jgi:hypothetical protein
MKEGRTNTLRMATYVSMDLLFMKAVDSHGAKFTLMHRRSECASSCSRVFEISILHSKDAHCNCNRYMSQQSKCVLPNICLMCTHARGFHVE